jgi:uncharacterized protein YhjY with autotransporter beta-barrel domain
MKKQIVLATIATLATGSVYATKARMNALGQGQEKGSFYIDDTRNVFRNAARINKTNNYAVTEWGTADTAASGTANNAEGGFFRNGGSINYGVYLGSNINDNDGLTGFAAGLGGSAVGTFSATEQDRSNDLDLFIGGDMGVEWGARIKYGSSKTEGAGTFLEAKHSQLGLGLGMVMGDLNAYVNYTLNDKYENNTGTASAGITGEDDGSMNIGVGYDWMDMTFFADYDKRAFEYVGGTGVAADTTERTVLTVGAGYTKEVSSTSRMFTDISYVNTSAEDKDGAVATTALEVDRSELPVTVGFETDATSWLTIRGSISQNILVNSQKVKQGAAAEVSSTRNDTTDVQAGATLNFGKLMIDGMIGTGGAGGTATATDAGTLSLDRVMTQVAVHYWF